MPEESQFLNNQTLNRFSETQSIPNSDLQQKNNQKI